MVYTAFDAAPVLKSLPIKVECAGLWESCILIGGYDGSVRTYIPEEEGMGSGTAGEATSWGGARAYKLKDTRIGFARRSVIQMDVLHSRNLLMTLADGVSLHALPQLDLIVSLPKTRGANLYAWNEERGLLCAAVKKKLSFYRFNGNREFSEMKEIAVPDMVRTMTWSGECLLLGLSTKREYWLVDSITWSLNEVSSSGRSAPPMVVALPGGEVLLGKDNISVFVDKHGKSTRPGDALSWSEAPASVAVAPPYVLGRLSRFVEVRSLWPGHALVQALPLSGIAVLAAGPQGMVAASERDVHLIQPVPLGMQILQLSVAGDYEGALALCALLPPEDAHLRASKEDSIHIRYGYHLFDEGNYVEAMEQFIQSMLDLPSILALFPSIHLPDAAAELAYSETVSSTAGGTTSEGDLARVDSWAGSEGLSPKAGDQLSEDRGPLTGGELAQALGALVGYLTNKRAAAVTRAEAEQAEEDVVQMLDDDREAGESVGAGRSRTRAAQRDENGDSEGLGMEGRTVQGAWSSVKISTSARAFATVLDTALVQALLAMDNATSASADQQEGSPTLVSTSLDLSVSVAVSAADSATTGGSALAATRASAFRSASESAVSLGAERVSHQQLQQSAYATSVLLQILTGPNYCDVETCGAKMMEAGRYVELLALYRRRGLHRKALELLRDLAGGKGGEGEQQIGPQATVEYLKALEVEESPLIVEFSGWLLREHPQLGLGLFTTLEPPLPTGVVLEQLKAHAPPLRAAYLEHLLGTVGSQGAPAGLHDELVQLHLDRVLDERSKQLAAGQPWEETHFDESRSKLLSILERSTAYSPAAMLARLPRDAFHSERALLLGKMRLHLPVLALLARKLMAPTKCVAYCDLVFDSVAPPPQDSTVIPSVPHTNQSRDSDAANIYLTLLRVYLDPMYTMQEFNRTLAAILPSAQQADNPALEMPRTDEAGGSRPSLVKPTPDKLGTDKVGVDELSSAGPPISTPMSIQDTPRARRGGLGGKKIARIDSFDHTIFQKSVVVRQGGEEILEEEQNEGEEETEVGGSQELEAEKEKRVDEWGLEDRVMGEEALDAMAQRWERIDGVAALAMLPMETPLKGLLGYLQPVLMRLAEAQRNAAVVKSLRRAESLQVREELLKQRRRMVKVTGERACAICHKRIGSSVFAVYPDNTVVHFVCHQDRRFHQGDLGRQLSPHMSHQITSSEHSERGLVGKPTAALVKSGDQDRRAHVRGIHRVLRGPDWLIPWASHCADLESGEAQGDLLTGVAGGRIEEEGDHRQSGPSVHQGRNERVAHCNRAVIWGWQAGWKVASLEQALEIIRETDRYGTGSKS